MGRKEKGEGSFPPNCCFPTKAAESWEGTFLGGKKTLSRNRAGGAWAAQVRLRLEKGKGIIAWRDPGAIPGKKSPSRGSACRWWETKRAACGERWEKWAEELT